MHDVAKHGWCAADAEGSGKVHRKHLRLENQALRDQVERSNPPLTAGTGHLHP